MMHLTDEQMMEQIYGESENTAAVEQHLAACRECAQSFAELRRDLAALDRVEAPHRDAHYGERVWAAIAPALAVYAGKRRWWSSGWLQNPWMKGLTIAAACALLVSVAFYAGSVWQQQRHPGVTAVRQAPAPPPRQPIVVVVLDDHLDRSERFLVELKHADLDSTATDSPMRDEARTLLAANRICRKNAAQTDDPELNTALDHLDSLLAEAANAPGGLNAENISKLQDEMNSEAVLFEVRVLRSRIAHRKGTGDDPAKGGTI
jgi:hypothetical protein